MTFISKLLPSVRLISALIAKVTAILEALALREQKAAEAKLQKAGALVTAANSHRAEAHSARKVSQAIRDLVS